MSIIFFLGFSLISYICTSTLPVLNYIFILIFFTLTDDFDLKDLLSGLNEFVYNPQHGKVNYYYSITHPGVIFF